VKGPKNTTHNRSRRTGGESTPVQNPRFQLEKSASHQNAPRLQKSVSLQTRARLQNLFPSLNPFSAYKPDFRLPPGLRDEIPIRRLQNSCHLQRPLTFSCANTIQIRLCFAKPFVVKRAVVGAIDFFLSVYKRCGTFSEKRVDTAICRNTAP
jgi:hypothetical protein